MSTKPVTTATIFEGNRTMKFLIRKAMALAIVAGMGIHPVLAEDEMQSMPGMDHGTMQGMDHDSMKTPAKNKKQNQDATGTQEMDHSNMPGMDHSTASQSDSGMTGMEGMGSMQGGSAPADARDPHANSGGYEHGEGPYALPARQRLRMADQHNFASLLVDRLEAVQTADGNSRAYDLQAWFGRDYDRAVLKAEGNYSAGALTETSTELLWSHAVSSFWNRELGVRYDGGQGPGRTWLAFGFQGLAPYWFEVDATAYVGEGGNTALGLEAEYETLFTQKWILQTRAEASLYGQDDAPRGIGSGLSELAVGVRLRYEIRREFAPYVGIEWAGKFGGTADYASAGGEPTSETKAIAGLRFWF